MVYGVGDLVAAWQAWDRHPGAEYASRVMEEACQAEAKEIGTDATELRVLLALLIRKGMKRAEALQMAREMLG